MKTIRKFTYPILKVCYKQIHIGDIENEHELLMFRYDMVGNPEHNLYRLITPEGTGIDIDKFGCFPYVEEIEHQNKLLRGIIKKQMGLRLAE